MNKLLVLIMILKLVSSVIHTPNAKIERKIDLIRAMTPIVLLVLILLLFI